MDQYCIKDGYTHRLDNQPFDDTHLTDEWQDEVYAAARLVFNQSGLTSVMDIGTGSGYKLMKYFDDVEDTLGIDLIPTVAWLKEKYPQRKWTSDCDPTPVDLVICSDVIEHVPDADGLLDFILACKPKIVVFSTPDRARLQYGQDGPPKNLSHVREWTAEEFSAYISQRFQIQLHSISNEEQCTQLILAVPK